MQGWAASGQALHFELLPAYSVLNPGAERLCAGFLGGESCGVALCGILFAAAVGDFLRGKDSAQKAVTESEDGRADAIDFDDVDAGADEHARKLNEFSLQSKRHYKPGHQWADFGNS